MRLLLLLLSVCALVLGTKGLVPDTCDSGDALEADEPTHFELDWLQPEAVKDRAFLATNKRPLLYLFSSGRCPHCRALLEDLALAAATPAARAVFERFALVLVEGPSTQAGVRTVHSLCEAQSVLLLT